MRVSSGAVARRAVLAGLASSGLVSSGLAPSLAHALDAQPIATPPPANEVASLAARSQAERLTVEVRINGRGPYRFIVDTGAEASVLSTEAAAELGLVPGPSVIVEGLARRIPAETARVTELGFGPFRRKNLLLPLLPKAMLGCDGYLGLDAIEGTRVTFDFANSRIKIEQPPILDLRVTNRFTNIKLQMAGRAGYLRTNDCWIDGVSATAFIDTGAEITIGNVALAEALRRKGRIAANPVATILTGITGGEAVGEVIPVRRIELDILSFTDSVVAIVDVPNFATWSLATTPALLIGMNFLRQFANVTIDYRSGQVRFGLASLSQQGQLLAQDGGSLAFARS